MMKEPIELRVASFLGEGLAYPMQRVNAMDDSTPDVAALKAVVGLPVSVLTLFGIVVSALTILPMVVLIGMARNALRKR